VGWNIIEKRGIFDRFYSADFLFQNNARQRAIIKNNFKSLKKKVTDC
jgi:hypothetical protein